MTMPSKHGTKGVKMLLKNIKGKLPKNKEQENNWVRNDDNGSHNQGYVVGFNKAKEEYDNLEIGVDVEKIREIIKQHTKENWKEDYDITAKSIQDNLHNILTIKGDTNEQTRNN